MIHSGTNKAKDSLGEILRHHSYSIGYNALLDGVQYIWLGSEKTFQAT